MDDHMRIIKKDQRDSDTSEPTTARQFYQSLPDTLSFSTFFQMAEDEGVDTTRARRFLRHFLSHKLLAQNGSQLTKQKRNRKQTAS